MGRQGHPPGSPAWHAERTPAARRKQAATGFIVISVVILWFIGFLYYLKDASEVSAREHQAVYDAVYQRGYRAAKAGLPPEEYSVWCGSEHYNAWTEGYVQAKEEMKAEKK
jgi:hypothetical protein